jgi:hypothetical protein
LANNQRLEATARQTTNQLLRQSQPRKEKQNFKSEQTEKIEIKATCEHYDPLGGKDSAGDASFFETFFPDNLANHCPIIPRIETTPHPLMTDPTAKIWCTFSMLHNGPTLHTGTPPAQITHMT